MLLLAALYLALLLAGFRFAAWATAELGLDLRLTPGTGVHHTVVASVALYVLLMALPFVPAAEIGLMLMAVFGSQLSLVVYLATLAALLLSFAIGRLVPERVLIATLGRLRLHRARALVAAVEGLSAEARLRYLLESSPSRWLPWLLRHRHFALALAVAMPGNVLIGGGGGIAMVAGLSRLYSLAGFLLAVGVAVAPVPLAVTLAAWSTG